MTVLNAKWLSCMETFSYMTENFFFLYYIKIIITIIYTVSRTYIDVYKYTLDT